MDARRALRHLDLGENVVLRDLADIYRKGEADIFRTHGAAIGQPWKSLKPPTIKARARLAKRFGLPISGPAPILVNYGDLRAALTRKGGAHNQFVGRNYVRLDVEQDAVNRHDRTKGLGLGLTKSGRRRKPRGKAARRYPKNIVEIHDEGKGTAPKRKILGVPAAREAEMDRRVDKYLQNTMRIVMGAD